MKAEYFKESIPEPIEGNPFYSSIKYYDDKTGQPTKELRQCAKVISNNWTSDFKIINAMNESSQVTEYRGLLDIAPFSWTSIDDNNETRNRFVTGVFSLP